jgi:F0F1-type ATP synthase assembly protein I
MAQTDQADQVPPDDNRRNTINTVLIVMVAQVGCLSLVIILLSVLGGLWLDNTLGTKPFFTLILLLAGVPISVLLMVTIGRRTAARIKSQPEAKKNELSA